METTKSETREGNNQSERGEQINSREKTAAGGGLDKGWDTKDGFDDDLMSVS